MLPSTPSCSTGGRRRQYLINDTNCLISCPRPHGAAHDCRRILTRPGERKDGAGVEVPPSKERIRSTCRSFCGEDGRNVTGNYLWRTSAPRGPSSRTPGACSGRWPTCCLAVWRRNAQQRSCCSRPVRSRGRKFQGCRTWRVGAPQAGRPAGLQGSRPFGGCPRNPSRPARAASSPLRCPCRTSEPVHLLNVSASQ